MTDVELLSLNSAARCVVDVAMSAMQELGVENTLKVLRQGIARGNEKTQVLVRVVPEDNTYALCVHQEPVHAQDFPYIDATVYPQIHTEKVPLTWQLQMDGTYRMVGKCPYCGAIYCTEEERQ